MCQILLGRQARPGLPLTTLDALSQQVNDLPDNWHARGVVDHERETTDAHSRVAEWPYGHTSATMR